MGEKLSWLDDEQTERVDGMSTARGIVLSLIAALPLWAAAAWWAL